MLMKSSRGNLWTVLFRILQQKSLCITIYGLSQTVEPLVSRSTTGHKKRGGGAQRRLGTNVIGCQKQHQRRQHPQLRHGHDCSEKCVEFACSLRPDNL